MSWVTMSRTSFIGIAKPRPSTPVSAYFAVTIPRTSPYWLYTGPVSYTHLTGSHATTQMCLEALELVAAPGKNILDLGCGSGILAIAAMLLGCDNAIGCDIDEKAPAVAMENAERNGIDPSHISVVAGDIVGCLLYTSRCV